MPDLVPLVLKKTVGSVNPGEVAGYLPEVAERMVKTGIAELFHPSSAVAEVTDTASGADTVSGETEADPAEPSAGNRRRR